MEKPDDWIRGEIGDRSHPSPRTVLVENILCHPEPTPLQNSGLWVWEIPTGFLGRGPGYHRVVLEGYVLAAKSRPGEEVKSPIKSSDLDGPPALALEIESSVESPYDGSTVLFNTRYWSVPLRDRVVLLEAQQPAVPDPECSADLERAIREVLLRLGPSG